VVKVVDGYSAWDLVQLSRHSPAEDESAVSESDYLLSIEEPTFSEAQNSSMILQDINFSIGAGKLIAVIGPVGSRNSALLSALASQMVHYHTWCRPSTMLASPVDHKWHCTE
jgi:ABC-type protease/lipase transport system fused ATPase/permease subunit